MKHSTLLSPHAAAFAVFAVLGGCAGLTVGESPSNPDPGADPELSAPQESSDIVPDETRLRPTEQGLTGVRTTVAGLGDPGKPGLWLETPLVTAQGPGRIRLASGGGMVAVTLLPVPGAATAGSRLSLEAMRQLGAPLTELVELTVTPGG